MPYNRQIRTFQDILDVMDGDPEIKREFVKRIIDVARHDDAIRQDMLKEILLADFMDMPAQLLRIENKLEQISQDQGTVKTNQCVVGIDTGTVKNSLGVVKPDISAIKTNMGNIIINLSAIKTTIGDMKTNLDRISVKIGRLAGNDYQDMAVEHSRRQIRQRLGVLQATVIYCTRNGYTPIDELPLGPAVSKGLISLEEAHRLGDADSILRCEDRDGNVIHAVAEISVSVQDNDRERAADRAEILAAATGTRVVPFVVGQSEGPSGVGVPIVDFIQLAQ